jgi:hypothetical protein
LYISSKSKGSLPNPLPYTVSLAKTEFCIIDGGVLSLNNNNKNIKKQKQTHHQDFFQNFVEGTQGFGYLI